MVLTKDGQPLPGTSYRLLRRIGAGSCSEVFEATGRRGELRALKLLRAMHDGSSEVGARLVQEGRALSALSHPHVVKVEEVGVTSDGRPFLVMPRLFGETLRERLDARGPLPTAAAVRIAIQVLGGLAAAHHAGIVHRDVKPANVFLAQARGGAQDAAGAEAAASAVLIDFGIAKVSCDGLEPSTGSHVLGTPRYLSPEQILGGEIDARTDVYAVGLLLFEAITGRGPFQVVDSMAVMRAHLNTPAPRLRSLLWVPPALDHAVARALEKAPGLRWQTADAMAAALAEVQGGDGGGETPARDGGEGAAPEDAGRSARARLAVGGAR
ncbi:protein kinase [Sorangium cellulosum]|uniref:Protein kinase n=1 Tax=Sorangium cellulosum TaxID=56 RepID=A0A2L0F741_SORCE|nr:serine/threonine-protein kinase [Sorangium cellulosum]AUX47414.1 protein kinase [Sorangium cellulosum]